MSQGHARPEKARSLFRVPERLKGVSGGAQSVQLYELTKFLFGLPGPPGRTPSIGKKPIETRKYKIVPEAYQRGELGPEKTCDQN